MLAYRATMARRPPIPVSAWTDPRHIRGWDGEQAAAAWFLGQGWSVEALRFRVGHHDLDLVVRQGSLVAFVEVKTRTPSRFGDGREAVGWQKQRRILRLAEVWRARHPRPRDRYRFDVVVVTAPLGQVTHLPDAWRPSAHVGYRSAS